MSAHDSVPALRRRLLELVQGYRITQVLHAAASLGIGEALRGEPRDSHSLAAAVGAHEPSLVRLLRALIRLDLVRRTPDGRYTLTEAGRLLDAEHPGSVRAGFLFEGSILYEHWIELAASVRTGQNVYQRRYGVDAWTYRLRHAELGLRFDAAMQEYSAARVSAVLAAYDFSGLHRIIDVGGGRGSLLAGILKSYPAARGVLFDQPAVVVAAGAVLGAAGVADRCEVVGGSFFERVPPDGDAYILSVVVHDWDDERAAAILATCRRAMSSSSRLLLIERLLPDEPGGSIEPYLQDLNMMHSLAGRERSQAEYRALLAGSGFRLARIVATDSPFAVIEASVDA